MRHPLLNKSDFSYVFDCNIVNLFILLNNIEVISDSPLTEEKIMFQSKSIKLSVKIIPI